jgi:predicted TIM-barrel fold metal-dependent hydrolase
MDAKTEETGPIEQRDFTLEHYDTTQALAHASEQAIQRKYEDFLIVDVDSHHYESEAFHEIVEYIDDPVLRQNASHQGLAKPGLGVGNGSYQELNGRIIRYRGRRKEKVPPKPHRDITLMRRWMDAMGVDIACLFPAPMLNLSLSPNVAVQTGLAWGYNRWLCERILAEEPRIKSMIYLPFHDPEACIKTVEYFTGKPGVIGFMVTSTHHRSVFENHYIKLYAMLQERGYPLAFHSATGSEAGLQLFNKFFGVHALGFCWHNMVYLTNWIINAMPERFPKLKTIWIESGLAWIPFLMQRRDNEYMMRSSEVPLLKRKPSEYMREMYYSTQPMELVDNREALELTFKLVNAESQLLYASDFPHWDMDLPSTIYDLPFLKEDAKRNILGGNAQRLFNLEPVWSPQKLARRAAKTGAARAG